MTRHEIRLGLGVTLTLAWEAQSPVVPRHYRRASGSLVLRMEPTGGSLRGERNVGVDAEALEAFSDALTRLLDELTGSATLEPTLGLEGEGDFALSIKLHLGKGDIHGFMATRFHPTRLSFAGYEVDQSDLRETQRQLRALLAAG